MSATVANSVTNPLTTATPATLQVEVVPLSKSSEDSPILHLSPSNKPQPEVDPVEHLDIPSVPKLDIPTVEKFHFRREERNDMPSFQPSKRMLQIVDLILGAGPRYEQWQNSIVTHPQKSKPDGVKPQHSTMELEYHLIEKLFEAGGQLNQLRLLAPAPPGTPNDNRWEQCLLTWQPFNKGKSKDKKEANNIKCNNRKDEEVEGKFVHSSSEGKIEEVVQDASGDQGEKLPKDEDDGLGDKNEVEENEIQGDKNHPGVSSALTVSSMHPEVQFRDEEKITSPSKRFLDTLNLTLAVCAHFGQHVTTIKTLPQQHGDTNYTIQVWFHNPMKALTPKPEPFDFVGEADETWGWALRIELHAMTKMYASGQVVECFEMVPPGMNKGREKSRLRWRSPVSPGGGDDKESVTDLVFEGESTKEGGAGADENGNHIEKEDVEANGPEATEQEVIEGQAEVLPGTA
ncbi:hypothetical protein TREMEDRAFT_59223 [Tremella mesenterica DSM 1558]|uniref:uncharacterized protein n=1 Tax=Tremella mesenterica (strain ATCC 24925 / CBS 8224 / DSM 1558 / NBRC 9311 / NRRL Y-6157 / RJB 2259-6 / UBC 559-6) TaxID=578456 RepID=UPI0003F4950D|nr:uncharacterized protein TREMEDRAFT_59223 [Tremella mesenterica DSM 1558]EIW73060.1 hypothetical protein TREMEDRAFT_59223 [Tremella mesenterica DSM 1558]